MGVQDDLEFRMGLLYEKMVRINETATKFEAKPTDKKLSNTLKVMTADLDDLLTEFDGIITKLAAIYSKKVPPDTTDLKTKFSDFEVLFYNAKSVVITLLQDQNDANESRLPRLSLGAAGNNGTTVSIPLPKLKLLEFSGDLMEWQAFYDSFNSSVASQEHIPPIQKLRYLKGQLTGEPLALVSSIPTTAANYKTAWDLLINKYSDNNRLTNAYLEALFDLPTLTKDAKQLRSASTALTKCMGGLEALGHEVQNWDVLLLFVMRKKLNHQLREHWERRAIELVMPRFKDFQAFLDEQFRVLEAARPVYTEEKPAGKNQVPQKSAKGLTKTTSLVTSTGRARACPCKKTHSLEDCEKFRQMTVGARFNFSKARGFCLRCLSGDHFSKDCGENETCKFCGGTHSEFLCFKKSKNSTEGSEIQTKKLVSRETSSRLSTTTVTESPPSPHSSNVSALQTLTTSKNSLVMLCTARAVVKDKNGVDQQVKILIDTASQGTFITSECVNRLGLCQKASRTAVFGLGQLEAGEAKGIVRFQIRPRTDPSFSLDIEALVVDYITQCPKLPTTSLDWPHLKSLPLADSTFYDEEPIDILLGAEWYARIVIGAPIVGPEGTPDAMNTIFGYSLLGRVNLDTPKLSVFCLTFERLDQAIRKFWKLEEPPSSESILSEEEKQCERHYVENFRRKEGRYIVSLPFVHENPELGNSYSFARRRFSGLERKLAKFPALREKYNEFMLDYRDQGHMVRVQKPPAQLSYYIPHHCIYQEDGKFSRFRVVFDCSMKSSNGRSLNDLLHKGPKLQLNIVDILVRFRLHDVCLVSDIKQMYRNIDIIEQNLDLQRIFWRFNPSDPIEEFCLTTVVYGNSASPFLAIRTLKQLAADEGKDFPLACKAISENVFMDDFCCSMPSLESAQQLQEELITLLSRGRFSLKKWNSNKSELLSRLPPEDCKIDPSLFSFVEDDMDPGTAILGLAWNPLRDTLLFRVKPMGGRLTKRSISSQIAKLYDPLGLMSPVVFYGKWMLQHLWQLGLDWDDRPPPNVVENWNQYQEELYLLSSFEIDRCVGIDSAMDVQLHGFADSSEKGFCAVVYVRGVDDRGQIATSLMLAKSKVAPLQKITLARLELCALVLLAKLVSHVQHLLKGHCPISSVTAWSDSMIALQWVKSPPHKWKTFVANRVSQIQESLPPDSFRYVPSSSNPSDLGSRGALPRQFLLDPMWKTGPPWLRMTADHWPNETVTLSVDKSKLETKVTVMAIDVPTPHKFDWISRFSNFTKLRRATAYWIRYITHLRNPRAGSFKIGGPTTDELENALSRLVFMVQQDAFPDLTRNLKSGKKLPSRMRKLSPFLDDNGVIRVGGRLKNSEFAFQRKHPMLLPKSHHLTNLIIDHVHLMYFHAGPMHVHSIVQTRFWIVNAREVIRHKLAKCVDCFRVDPKANEQQMGQLPTSRLRAIYPFYTTGIDYGGPFNIKMGRVRNAKIFKGYICLFICFSTRAIHLELASDLSTDAFIAALRRFIARRGGVSEIHSDCGTNFVGAKRKIAAWYEIAASKKYNEQADRLTSERGISWKFNPPGSPHIGGLWEAAIKSVKKHLVRAIGTQVFTYEEFYTILVQIEAIVNSRPMTPLSSSPHDIEALTPGHFIMQRPAFALLEPPEGCGQNIDLSQRWKLMQQLVNSFWKRWRNDYLCTLQTRSKWTKTYNNLEVGDLVIMKEPNIPPCRWKLARVIKTFPGDDGVVRVAEVKTPQGVYSRTVHNLCPIPKA